jgi:hypothetical protein
METKEKCCGTTDEAEEKPAGQSAPMMEMMKNMMSKMGKGDPMPSEQHGMPMEKMMGMCHEMLGSVKETAALAAFGTPALRKLFNDWLAKLEEQAVQLMKKDGSIDAKALAAALSLDEESAAYLIARLARREDMEVRAKKACGC